MNKIWFWRSCADLFNLFILIFFFKFCLIYIIYYVCFNFEYYLFYICFNVNDDDGQTGTVVCLFNQMHFKSIADQFKYIREAYWLAARRSTFYNKTKRWARLFCRQEVDQFHFTLKCALWALLSPALVDHFWIYIIIFILYTNQGSLF